MMTIEEAKKMMIEIAEQTDYYELAFVPLKRNNRLKTCLGRCWTAPGLVEKIELSGDLLDAADRHTVREVLVHELCHGILALKYPDRDDIAPHGKEFQDEVRALGGTHIGAAQEIKFDQKVLADKSAYTVQCPKCQAKWFYKTKCKAVIRANNYYCNCGSEEPCISYSTAKGPIEGRIA